LDIFFLPLEVIRNNLSLCFFLVTTALVSFFVSLQMISILFALLAKLSTAIISFEQKTNVSLSVYLTFNEERSHGFVFKEFIIIIIPLLYSTEHYLHHIN